MRGYWKAEAETARVLRDGWYHTGDVGYVDEQGYVFIVDRKKEMIKTLGFGVAPAELEAVLLEHPAVREAAVIGWPDERAGEIPRAFVALREGASITDEELMVFANGKLANYKAIRRVDFVAAIPKTASGKIFSAPRAEGRRPAVTTVATRHASESSAKSLRFQVKTVKPRCCASKNTSWSCQSYSCRRRNRSCSSWYTLRCPR